MKDSELKEILLSVQAVDVDMSVPNGFVLDAGDTLGRTTEEKRGLFDAAVRIQNGLKEFNGKNRLFVMFDGLELYAVKEMPGGDSDV